jgi:hypothetical protein
MTTPERREKCQQNRLGEQHFRQLGGPKTRNRPLHLGRRIRGPWEVSSTLSPRHQRVLRRGAAEGKEIPLSTNRCAAFVSWFRGLDWGSACGGPSTFLSSWRSQSLKHPTLKSGQPSIQRQRQLGVAGALCTRFRRAVARNPHQRAPVRPRATRPKMSAVGSRINTALPEGAIWEDLQCQRPKNVKNVPQHSHNASKSFARAITMALALIPG